MDWTSSWRDTFEGLLNNDSELVCGGQWSLNFSNSLTEDLTDDERRRGWKIFICNAHAHFKCGSCRHSWPSARVKLLFHYQLQDARGTVVMRPLGQACRRCNNDVFYRPGFSSEEIERALLRVFAKIRQKCYGVEEPTGVGGSHDEQMTKPHERALCEACKLGICQEKDN